MEQQAGVDYKKITNAIMWWGNSSFYIINKYHSDAYITIKNNKRTQEFKTTTYNSSMKRYGVKCRYYYIHFHAPFLKTKVNRYSSLGTDCTLFNTGCPDSKGFDHTSEIMTDTNNKDYLYYSVGDKFPDPFIVRMVIYPR